jgi:putative copper resistance protein D
VFWLVGVFGLLYVSNGGVNAYREFLFTAQTIAQMLVIAIVPIFLVLAAPLLLASQTVRSRTDGSRGGREWIKEITDSRLITLAATPFAAAGILVVSLVVSYYPPLLGWGISDHIGHQWTIISSLFVGILLATSAIRPSASVAARLSAVGIVAATYTISGIVLLTSTGLLQPDGYGALAEPWGVNPVQDQQASGALVLSIGILHTIVLAAVIIRARHPFRSRNFASSAPDRSQ